MKKNRILLALPLLFLALFINVSCDDDDDPTQDPLVGLYILTNATTNEAVVISDMDDIPAGANITPYIAGALLADVNCTDDQNIRVQLTEGGLVNYLCKGEGSDPSQQGTWSVNDARTQLLLTLNIGDNSVPITLNSLDETGGNINGDVTLQLPGSVFGSQDGFVTINMNITFVEDTL
ncbi:hypothetical protein OO013_04095 [Mangrovivirga sp. M17]|uniref:Lipocalin-like domain-containing protein n=1 Tax=Mangrovivirga halotolerans TaxID=2993936 RepID=A0ABT3RNH9_9BACT|nr:hypothetical protein [Mangrovivirga halotolerans]MCX2743031.1 hypothetical protein [Mangrovivirga halotolerans]